MTTILIVDEEPMILDVLVQALEDEGDAGLAATVRAEVLDAVRPASGLGSIGDDPTADGGPTLAI